MNTAAYNTFFNYKAYKTNVKCERKAVNKIFFY